MKRYTSSRQDRLSTFTIRGEIQAGSRFPYSVLGQDFEINADTWIIGDISIGSVATVHGIAKPGYGNIATKVVASI
jgi:hypothetical protein